MNTRQWMPAATIVMGLAAPVAAQDAAPASQDPAYVERVAAIERQAQSRNATPEELTQDLDKMTMLYKAQVMGELRAKIAVEGKIVKNAPYAAEAITESTQTLADGNRIVRKSVTRVYRDGEGRTRREDLDDGVVRGISIVDPVAGTSVMLQPDTRTAYANQPVFVMAGPGGSTTEFSGPAGRGRVMISADGRQGFVETVPGEEVVTKIAAEKQRLERQQAGADAPPPPPAPPLPGGANGAAGVAPPPPPPAPLPARGGGRGGRDVAVARAEAGTTTREDLGRQNIEGVPATGSRVTTIIAAGAIGNDQPIKSVSDQWFSPDLQVLVLTKHSDPRQGETTYRLSNIVRAEPDRSLFIVPSDYTYKASGIRQRLESR
jgi:hypothetical protein